MDPTHPGEKMYMGLMPQISGLVTAAFIFLLGKALGEKFLGETLGLVVLVPVVYLALAFGGAYMAVKAVYRVEQKHNAEYEIPLFHFLFVIAPYGVILVYAIMYAARLY